MTTYLKSVLENNCTNCTIVVKNRLKDVVNSLIPLSKEEDYDDDDEMQLQEMNEAEKSLSNSPVLILYMWPITSMFIYLRLVIHKSAIT